MSVTKKRKIQNYSFKTSDILGQGSYGVVYKGHDDVKDEQVAVKVINKDKMKYSQYLKQALRLEVNILNKIKSPNIVALKQFIETQNNYYIIQQFCNNGDLEKLLRKEKRLKQQVAINFIAQILTGFHQLIRNGIVHRDLKPQNILMKDGIIKIADFGIARPKNQEVLLHSLVGTPYYQCPQLLQGLEYTQKCDIWALGLIFYQMLYGQTPWKYGGNPKTYLENIKNKTVEFPNEPQVSKEAKLFITDCLTVEEEERINWIEIFQSDLFKGKLPKLQNTDCKFKYAMAKLRKSIHSNNLDVERFFHKLKLQKTNEINLKQFTYILQRLCGDLTNHEAKNIFDKVDSNKNGSIDIQEFKTSLKNAEIRIQSLNGRDLKKFLKVMIGDEINKVQALKEEELNNVTDRIRNQMQKKQIYDLYEIFINNQNSDNHLNIQAFHGLLKKIDESVTQHEAELLFEKFDENKDKKISIQQFYRNMCIITGTPIMSQSRKIV